ncbi:MAG: glycosyltransferase, partial [Gimesia sp.]
MKSKWKVLLINSKRSDPNYYICLQIRNALKHHDDVEKVVLADYSNAATIVQGDSFNLLFVYGGENINEPVIKVLKRACGNAIVWFTEDPYELNNNRLSSELFDLVFTNDPGSVMQYPGTAFFLPLASSKEFHFFPAPASDDAYRYDLSFIGTAWPNRTKFIDALMQEKPGFRYKLALPSNEHLPKFKLSVPESEINWRTPNTELAKIANASRFSLILHREFSASGNKDKAESPGPRLFEIAMAGGLLLVDDSIEINSDLFSPETEYIPFKNLKECVNQIEYYFEKSRCKRS